MLEMIGVDLAPLHVVVNLDPRHRYLGSWDLRVLPA
jgi:hypothetical protein